MNKSHKQGNIAGACVFGVFGTVALGAALFGGAPHQFAMAVVCAFMAAASLAEIRLEEKRAKKQK